MAIWQKHQEFAKITKKLHINTYLDPENHIFHEIYSICVHNYWKKSKNAKLIPWLDMKILKKSKNAKLIPWLDMKLVKKSKIPKLIPWPDMTLLNFHIFGVQLSIKISIFNEKSNFWYSDHPEITPGLYYDGQVGKQSTHFVAGIRPSHVADICSRNSTRRGCAAHGARQLTCWLICLTLSCQTFPRQPSR